jgi:hypothetical protein
MNCPICGKPMEVHEIRTTYNKNREEYQYTGYRCRKDDVWGMLEIPKTLLPEEKRIEFIVK